MSVIKMQFDEEVAKCVGVDCAIMLSNIEFWQAKNAANERHFYDGYYWTYNTVSAFTKLFSFWSIQNIRTILKKLEKTGYIKVGNYNKIKYDKTKWFTSVREPFVKKCTFLGENQQIDLLELTNGIAKTNKPIPDSKTDSKLKKSIKKNFIPPTVEEIQSYIDEKGYRIDAQKFFDYYNDEEWVDGNGNKVRSWKQKLQIWFKPENKIVTTDSMRQKIKGMNEEQLRDLIENGTFKDRKVLEKVYPAFYYKYA